MDVPLVSVMDDQAAAPLLKVSSDLTWRQIFPQVSILIRQVISLSFKYSMIQLYDSTLQQASL